MSWTDLFKSKSAKQRPDPQVRWFGKLPTYTDYYTSPSDEDWCVEFTDWVLKGFEILHGRASQDTRPARRLPIASCMVRLPQSGMTVVSSVLDFGGDARGRRFPMCFYVGVPTSDWPGPTSGHVCHILRVMEQLIGLQGAVSRFINSPANFDATFGGREIDLSSLDDLGTDEGWQQVAGGVDLSDWFRSSVVNPDVSDPSRWFALVEKWGETIASMESDSFDPTLRFPLCTGAPLVVQVSGWLRWLESRMALGRRALSMFVTPATEQAIGNVTVVARALMADDFLLMSPLGGGLGFVDDAAGLSDSGAGADASGDGVGGAMVHENWRDFALARAPLA
jgi:hypothetical protein